MATALIVGLLSFAALSATAVAGGGGLSRFLLRANEQPGFTRAGRPTVVRRLGVFLTTLYVDRRGSHQFRVDYRRLSSDGFAGAAQEVLLADNGREGFSLVIELATPAAARAERQAVLRHARRVNRGAALTPFTVSGVPSARGVTGIGGPQPGGTANVYWVEGRCLFGAGDYVPMPGTISEPVIAGVQALDHRVAGRCP